MAGVLETRSGSLLVTTFTSLAYETALKAASSRTREKLVWVDNMASHHEINGLS
jgi:hypothetical protein